MAKIKETNMKIRASLLATALACMPFAADAAGLGKITVYSGLGQPLRAEVEISATKAEISGMTARMAPRDSFAQAGIEYASTLQGIKFVLDQKGDKPVIRITSDRPVNDPFVDLLLELSWPSGRLVREYTFLLDPPELVVKGAPQISAVEARELPALADSTASRSTVEKPARVTARPKVAEEKKPAAEAKSAAEPKPAADGVAIPVKKGDNLHKIASENRPEGVSLDQMLVGLLRANKEAFDNGNMNRLKAGRILTVPDQEALAAVSPAEARKTVLAQASDWNAYRRKLAAAAAQSPARDESGQQAASGRVSARVDDQAAPAAMPKDQVKVAKTQTASSGKPAGGKASEEDLIARDKAVKEANERVQALEKNVSDLQKLLEMKNQSLADLQKQSATAPAPAAPAPASTPAAAPAAAPEAKVEAPSAPKVEAAATPEAPKTEEKPVEAAPAVESKPVAPAPAPAAVAPAPAPVVAEPSLVDDLLGNPMLLAAGGAVVAGLGAIAVLRRRRQGQQEAGSAAEQPTISSLSQASLGANSVFKSTGGQSVDTSNTPATDFSQAGPGTIDTDEVDPVAEADVYMAYGRDAQAEEILLEAMQKDPKRFAIHVKLLEIYANRKSVPQFEALASDIYAQTGGAGTDWEKAAAMGMRLDPANPLYQIAPAAVAPPAVPEFDPDATMIVASGALQEALAPSEAVPEPELPPEEPVVEAPADLAAGLDFDLDLGSPPAAEPEIREAAADSSLDFDLDLGAPSEAVAPAMEEAAMPEVLDFQLPEVVAEPEAAMGDENIIDFDLSPEAPAAVDEAEAAPAVEESPRAFDLSAINLDLEAPLEIAAEPALEVEAADVALPDLGGADFTLDEGEGPQALVMPEPAPVEEALVMPEVADDLSFDLPEASLESGLEVAQEAAQDDPRWQEVATKLDLAKAYEEMGDLEGSRELLQEVVSEGSPEQQERARALLASMG